MTDALTILRYADEMEAALSFPESHPDYIFDPSETVGLLRAAATTLSARDARIKSLEATLERHEGCRLRDIAQIKAEETAHEQTIGERDEAEDAISHAYYLILGKSPEWSNKFGYQQALEEIDDAQRLLREQIKQSDAQIKAMAAVLRRAQKYIQSTSSDNDLKGRH